MIRMGKERGQKFVFIKMDEFQDSREKSVNQAIADLLTEGKRVLSISVSSITSLACPVTLAFALNYEENEKAEETRMVRLVSDVYSSIDKIEAKSEEETKLIESFGGKFNSSSSFFFNMPILYVNAMFFSISKENIPAAMKALYPEKEEAEESQTGKKKKKK